MPLSRKRIIYDRDGVSPYMIRHHLIFREKSDHLERNVKVPFNAYLHKILLSDEPILHDHPWSWGTFIISGGYWEHTPKGTFLETAGIVENPKIYRYALVRTKREQTLLDTVLAWSQTENLGLPD